MYFDVLIVTVGAADREPICALLVTDGCGHEYTTQIKPIANVLHRTDYRPAR